MDPKFRKADEKEKIESIHDVRPIEEEPRDIDGELERRFHCPKCQHHGAVVRRLRPQQAALASLFEWDRVFIAASCARCGYTEGYNTRMLEWGDDLTALLDQMFASR